MKHNHVKMAAMTECAVFAAVLCIVSPFAIPIGPVPVTLQMFVILFMAMVQGPKKSTASVFIYIMLGCFGMPVFSGARGGATMLLGPTGGFILAYLPATFLTGLLSNIRIKNTKGIGLAVRIIAGFSGILVCYLIGTVWYALTLETGIIEAITVCIVPFVPFDILKVIAAAVFSDGFKCVIKRNKIS